MTVGADELLQSPVSVDTMPQRAQRVAGRDRECGLPDSDLAGHEFVIAEGAVEVLGLEARRFHGLLRRHAEIR